jgi:hypothetical protein
MKSLIALLVLCAAAHAREPELLVIDAPMGKPDHLYNFRKLPELGISGSSQFSELGLKAVKARLPAKRVTIVDLRQEAHGFAGGMPVSWEADSNQANKGRAVGEVRADEAKRLAGLTGRWRVDLTRLDATWSRRQTQVVPVKPGRTRTEEELAKSEGLAYVRFAVTDHTHPTDADVDRFVAFRKGDASWMHFHCKAGIGRTTVFMAMADMMRNARSASAREIVGRQGGYVKYDLENVRRETARARRDFLYRFHAYCVDQAPDFAVPWSVWSRGR